MPDKDQQHSRASEDILRDIEDAILDGRLQPGDKLPPERELHKAMGVSRQTVRESIRALENKGLVEVRRGTRGGVFVREANSDQMTASLSQLVRLKNISPRQMTDLRRELEGVISEKAAKHARKKSMDRLYDLLRQAQHHVREGSEQWHEFVEVDKEIHCSLADATGNPLYRFILEAVCNNIDICSNSAYQPSTPKTMEIAYRSLKEIVDAVAENDPEAARACAQKHVEFFN